MVGGRRTNRFQLSDQPQHGCGGDGGHRLHPRMGGEFLPGAGWITFDPTNRTVGDFSVIPIAVARDIKQAVPVSGSFMGAADDFLSMAVEVSVY
jgi:hypothetical protein